MTSFNVREFPSPYSKTGAFLCIGQDPTLVYLLLHCSVIGYDLLHVDV